MYFYLFLTSLFFLWLSSSCGETIDHRLCCRNFNISCTTNIGLRNKLLLAMSNSDADHVTIKLDGNASVINSTVKFYNKSSVSLIGTLNTHVCCDQNNDAGLVFHHIKHLQIKNVTFYGCKTTFKMASEEFAAGILIVGNSVVLLLANVVVAFSRGRGVVILKSRGNLTITNTSFMCNFNASKNGGGLYIKLNNSETRTANSSLHTAIKVVHCFFTCNFASYKGSLEKNSEASGIGDGGGLNVVIERTSNNIQILNCTFCKNFGVWGGGMGLALLQKAANNCITIHNCTFFQNAAKKGGGAVNIAYFTSDVKSNNSIHFINTLFHNNHALFGGGVHISSAQMDSRVKNSHTTMQFKNCLWHGNSAKYASAVYLNLRIKDTFNRDANLPEPSFESCDFINSYSNSSNMFTTKRSKGTFYSVGYRILFRDKVTFKNNTKTALYLISSTVIVQNNTNIVFENNTGQYGGAVALFGSSTFHLLGNNIRFSFFNNTAEFQGGAIFQQVSSYLSYIAKRNCFIHLLFFSHSTIKFFFQNNQVQSAGTEQEERALGKSIFLYSLDSCKEITNFSSNGKRVAFIFERSQFKLEISTEGKLEFNKSYTPGTYIQCIPGKYCDIPITVNNDFNLTVKQLIRIKSDHNSIRLHPSSTLLLNHTRAILLGIPGSVGVLTLSLLYTDDEKELKVGVRLRNCPPGYVYSGENAICQCSTLNERSAYFGIKSCNDSVFQAVLMRSVWIGFEEKNTADGFGHEQHLYSSLCPRRYCTKNMYYDPILLPETPDIREIDLLVCGPKRTGVVCGRCRENHSIFYHSENFDCYPNKLCTLGWLFYFLSEILPVTVVFVLITLFNIQLTSGSVQGFILFAQLFETLLITANEQIILEKTTYYALVVLRFIYRTVNFDFFTRIHFCLWKGASSLDIISIKYVTIAYSLILVLLVIVVMNKCGTSKYCPRTSSIHGLSGFFVLCYSQVTKVSLLLLTPVTLYSKGQRGYRKVAFYDGNLEFLRGKHLIYAIPALTFIFSFTFLPPALLIIYPLCYRVLALLHLEESVITKIVCKVAPIERLKPFFDSIQGCFKDNCRFFAGLYFLYRLTALISFAVLRTLLEFYTAIQIQFVLMFLLHFWAQPYKEKWHNYLDSVILAALLLVNALTICIHQIHLDNTSNHVFAHIIQIMVAYIPLLYLAAYCTLKVLKRLSKNWFINRNSQMDNLEMSLSDTTLRCDYKTLDIMSETVS